MATERNVVDFKIHNISEEQFQELKAQGKIDPNAIYCTPDDSLKTSQITNCITEIPQDIKLELADGVLTLKAGSKIYYPNGSGVFDEAILTTDKTYTDATKTGQWFVCLTRGLAGTVGSVANSVSGTTKPTAGFSLWYNTEENIMYRYGSITSDPTSNVSLPIAVVTLDNTGVASIDQVFNGFGYIGSTIFGLPNVKAMFPSGRNANGTLNNLVRTTVISTLQVSGTSENAPVYVSNAGKLYSVNKSIYYDEKSNLHVRADGTPFGVFQCGSVSFSQGKITSLNTKTTFHAVDYSDFETLSDMAVHKTGDETVQGVKTFTHTINTGAGMGVQITGTNNNFVLRSSGATPEGCGLFLDNNASIPAFNANSSKITIGSNTITPHSVTPDTSDNSTRIATTAFVSIKDSNAVHKTGDETISDTKTFAAPSLRISNVAGTGGTGLNILDSNGKGQTYLHHFYTGGRYYSRLVNRNATAEKTAYVEVVVDDDGKSIFTSYNVDAMRAPTPASTSNDTNIATTAFVKSVLSSSGNGLATFSKGQTGYYKFNNGLIIQWGRVGGSANERAINFPTSFSDTNYAIVANPTSSGTTESFYSIATDESQKYSSSCVLRCSGHINTVAWLWIAIGY